MADDFRRPDAEKCANPQHCAADTPAYCSRPSARVTQEEFLWLAARHTSTGGTYPSSANVAMTRIRGRVCDRCFQLRLGPKDGAVASGRFPP